jgi:hypothetical protein
MKAPKTFNQARVQKGSGSAESRRQQAVQRLGCHNPRCVHCGESDPLCLELHHIGGQAYDDALVTLCRNCHRKASDMQRDHPRQIDGEPDLLERAGHFLLGLANLFALLVEKCREFGSALLERAKAQSQANQASQATAERS